MVAYFSPALSIGGVMSLTFVDSATSNTTDIVIPATAAVGDIAILFESAFQGVTVGSVSGWTQIKTIGSGGDIAGTVWRRTLTAGQPGATVSSTTSAGQGSTLTMVVFRPSGAIATVTASTWNGEVTTGNPSQQTVSALGQTAPLIVFAFAAAFGTSFNFSVQTPAFASVVSFDGGDEYQNVGYTIYNSSPLDQIIDMADQGSNAFISGYLQFT